MLEAPPLETTNNKKPSSSSSLLFAFVPRQVTLAKHQNMTKKEELVVPKTPTMESTKKDKSKKDKKKKKKEGSDPSSLILSIASYLQKQGFTNTVTALQSEASIGQIDDLKAHDLEMLFYKYLEASTSITKSNKNVPEELGLPNAGVIKEDQEKGKSTAETASTDNTALGSQSHESEGKSKDKKRKKDKVAVENGGSETCILEGKPVAKKSSTDIQLDEENIKPKIKKKKNKSSEPDSKQDRKEVDQVELCKTDSTKESKLALENTTDSIDKKSSKKRKRMVSEVNESQSDVNIKTNGPGKENAGTLEDDTVSKDKKSSKKRKKMITEGNDFKLDGDEKKAGSLSLDDVVQENGFVEDRNTDKRSETPFKGVFHANGDVENERAGAGSQKTMKKQQNGSSEPKTAFQRVKVDEVKFADDRLQDNSYWAKSGADIGYGAKAQEVLGQVRGRDFRHEKTKKKRGSYRGGQIDLQTHSIKFNYSDEE